MNARLAAVLAAITRTGEPVPTNLPAALRGLPVPSSLPSPWETWTLFGFVRHRERQSWVAEIVRDRLQGNLRHLAGRGSLGHPADVPQSGSVPGLPEWEYYFHGRGCCVTHKVDGDAIDVDFHGGTAEYIDQYFYLWYLKSLRRPQPPEQRLLELHPSFEAIRLAIQNLLSMGAITPLSGRDFHPFRVAHVVLAHSPAIERFCSSFQAPERRVWCAALVGDWLAAHEATQGQPELVEITGPRAEACRDLREERILAELKRSERPDEALHALADLGSGRLDECVERVLNGPLGGPVSVALEITDKQTDARWCPSLFALFNRVQPEDPNPSPHLWIRAVRQLLRHGYRTQEVLAALPRAGGTSLGEAILLALEYAPNLSLPLIRQALISPIPINRIEVAAILGVIDRPWSRRELFWALGQSDDQELTSEVRATLLESRDPDTERAVVAWEENNPHEDEVASYLEVDGRKVGPFYTIGEIALKNAGARIQYEMERMHDQVMRLRDVNPDLPPSRQF